MVRKKVIITDSIIQERVKELGSMISSDFRDREPIVVGILNGAVFFFADLVRSIDIPVKMDFIRASSYGAEMESSGKVEITKDVELPIRGRPVILVEDIVDSGLTLAAVVEYIKGMGAASCSVCALIDKKERRQCDIQIDYIGFSVEEGFLVGYGLDYNENYRHLRDICLLMPADGESEGEN